MIFVDSSVWIDWFRHLETPQVRQLDSIASADLAVGDVVIAEVLRGIPNDREFDRTRQALFTLNLVQVGGAEIALEAARNHRRLRALGVTPRGGTIDTLIATRCIHEGWPLLTSDRDFRPFADHLGLALLS